MHNRRETNELDNDLWFNRPADVTTGENVMKIKSTVLKDYCLTIIDVLRDIGPSFDIGFKFYNTIGAQLYAVNPKVSPKPFGHVNIYKLMFSQKRRSLCDADSENFCSRQVMGHYMCLHI